MRETPTRISGGRRARQPYDWELREQRKARRGRRVAIALAILIFVVGALALIGAFFL